MRPCDRVLAQHARSPGFDPGLHPSPHTYIGTEKRPQLLSSPRSLTELAPSFLGLELFISVLPTCTISGCLCIHPDFYLDMEVFRQFRPLGRRSKQQTQWLKRGLNLQVPRSSLGADFKSWQTYLDSKWQVQRGFAQASDNHWSDFSLGEEKDIILGLDTPLSS